MKGVEVCVFSVDDAYAAEAAGAARLELCREYDKGGLIPLWDDLKRMSPQSSTDDSQLRGLRVPAVVMVRERGGDFAYSKKEKKMDVSEQRLYQLIQNVIQAGENFKEIEDNIKANLSN